MEATRVQRQSPVEGLGSKPPDAGNEHVKKSTDNHAHANFFSFYAYRTRNLQRNLSAINVGLHQIHVCSPAVDKAFSWHDMGMALWLPAIQMPLFQGLTSKNTKKYILPEFVRAVCLYHIQVSNQIYGKECK